MLCSSSKCSHQDFPQYFYLHKHKVSHHSCTGEEEVQIKTRPFPRHGLVMGAQETPLLLCSHHSAQAVGLLLFEKHWALACTIQVCLAAMLCQSHGSYLGR